MKRTFEGLHGLKIFAYDLISLISNSEVETIEEIEKQIEKECVVTYIGNKYKDKLTGTYDERCIYDLENWNKEFGEFSGYVDGNESRKYGVVDNNHGLLLLLALTVEMLKEPK